MNAANSAPQRVAMRGTLFLAAIPAGWIFGWLVSGAIDCYGPVKAMVLEANGIAHHVLEFLSSAFH